MEKVAPLSRFLTPSQRTRWEGAVRLFLARKTFVPCQGTRVDNDIRLSVAGQACLLLAGRPDLEVYPELSTIYLHPSTYVRRDDRSIGGGAIATDEEASFDGESWDHGAVVLSVRSVRLSFRFLDGFNVVLHEFAHQFDSMAGGSDGCPPMPAGLMIDWKHALDDHFHALRAADDRGEDPFLDPYGAESPVEFFAVAVEAFLELGPEFEAEHPKLYGMLREVFGMDPARW
jgi:Mlc titration factor MtfA (ptsG expression regulator)